MRVVLAKWVKEIELIDSIIGLVGVVLILSGALFIQFFLRRTTLPIVFTAASSICQYWIKSIA